MRLRNGDPERSGRQTHTTEFGRGERGHTLLEVSIALGVLMIGVAVYSQTVTSGLGSHRDLREHSLALSAARDMVEQLRLEPLGNVYERFNGAPEDDPGGVGTAPGPHFAVAGLRAQDGDADGLPGEILFPEGAVTGGTGLREDLTTGGWGLPYDLNNDGVVDSSDVTTDHVLLPALIRIRWTGAGGNQRLEVRTWLADD